MKKRTILILTILAAGLLMWKWLACGYNPDKPTEFYPILTRLNDGMKHEAFVVSNAPCDTSELRKIVEKYDIETLPLDTLEKYESISRTYYKETKYMTKDFKEGEEYNPVFSTWDNIQDFRNHIDDILMETHHYSVDTNQKYHTVWVHWDWDYKKGNKYVNRIKELFQDWNSFVCAKKKLYGIE